MGLGYDTFNNITADGTVSIGTTAVSVLSPRAGRRLLRVRNTHASQVLYLGTSDAVTSTVRTWQLAASAEVVLDGYCGVLWAIGSGAATTGLVTEGW